MVVSANEIMVQYVPACKPDFVIDACPGKKTHVSAHTVFTIYSDSMMYSFYLANAKSFSQMIALGAAVLRVMRPLLSFG